MRLSPRQRPRRLGPTEIRDALKRLRPPPPPNAPRAPSLTLPAKHTPDKRTPHPIPHLPAEIWDALKAACASDLEMAKVLLDAAEVKVMKPDMSVCYDARGFRYELPQYVLADPANLVA